MNLVSRHPLSSDSASVAFLIKLRWVAVISQLAVIASVRYFMYPELPFAPLLVLTAITGAGNVILSLYGSTSSHPDWWLRVVLVLDTLVLTAMLALSGGASNPFSVLYTLHVALAAMLAGPILTALVVLFSILGFRLLFVLNIPLPPELGGHIHGGGAFSAHLQGMWLAFSTAAMTIGYFVNRLSVLLRRERDEHNRTVRLLGLATLAAGAAHEIGNPLGTIKIAASEMKASLDGRELSREFRDDTKLILEEVDRAQRAIQRLALGAGELMGELPASMKLGDIVKRLDSQYSLDIARVELSCDHPGLEIRWPTQAVLQAVTQVLRNAIQVSSYDQIVTCRVTLAGNDVLFHVQDSGPGMPKEVQDRLGEPFFTTRDPGQGMGLGLFIARSLVENLGGSLEVDSVPGRGTNVDICIPVGAQA